MGYLDKNGKWRYRCSPGALDTPERRKLMAEMKALEAEARALKPIPTWGQR